MKKEENKTAYLQPFVKVALIKTRQVCAASGVEDYNVDDPMEF